MHLSWQWGRVSNQENSNFFDNFPHEDDYFSQFEQEEEPKVKENKSSDTLKRFGQGILDMPESMFREINARGKAAVEHVRQGQYPAAVHDIFNLDPFLGIAETIGQKLRGDINLTPDQATAEGTNQGLGLLGLPAKEAKEAYAKGDYARLAGQGVGAAATFLGPHALMRERLGERPGLVKPEIVPESIPRDIQLPTAREQLALPQGHYTVDPQGNVFGGEQVNRQSMRESLGGNLPLKGKSLPDIISKPTKSEVVEPKTAQDFIAAKKAGQIPEGTSFADWTKPAMARTEEGKVKVGFDQSLADMLGSSLYKGDIAKIATKELFQNSMDATRHLGEMGKIEVIFNQPSNAEKNPGPKWVQVSDNGPGMDREALETVFTNLGSSGKRNDESAAGGFGVAKASFLLGGKKVQVKSVVEKKGKFVEYSFEGTPKELNDKGVDVKARILTDAEIEEGKGQTGTTVRTYVPDDTYFYDARNFAQKLAETSDYPGKITSSRTYDEEPPGLYSKDEFQKINFEKGTKIPISAKTADMDLFIPEGTEYSERAGVPIDVMNNGIYQNTMQYGGYESIPNVPERVIVNIKSKVSEGDTDYPFTMNREELRGSVHEALSKYIDEHIVKPGRTAQVNFLKEAYDKNMRPISDFRGTFHVYDVGNKFTPDELTVITHNKNFRQLAFQIRDIIGDTLLDQNDQEKLDYLDRTGIIFDEKVKGIWIPNPGEKQAAVLINPLQVMLDRDPSGAAMGIMHTIQHEVTHFWAGRHDENFTSKLSEVIENMGDKDFGARQAIKQTITGPDGNYLPEIQDILSKYAESRRRKATIDDPLYRTGIKSRNNERKGTGKVSGDSRPPSGRAIDKLMNALAEAKINMQEQEAINTTEHARQAAGFESVKQGGRAGFAKRMAQMRGEFEKIEGDRIKLSDKDVDALYNEILNNKGITTFEKARAGTALGKILTGTTPQRNELALLDRIWGPGTSQQIIELQGGIGAIGLNIAKVANTMKTMRATLDLSAPLRQGAGLVLRKEYWGAFKDMFSYAVSKKAMQSFIDGLEKDPQYLFSRDAGLFLADHSLENYEEQFLNSYIGDIRRTGRIGEIATEPFSASERAYVGFLNQVRFNTFKSMVADAEKAGFKTFEMRKGERVPTQLTRDIARYINNASGRGSLGKLEKVGQELNTVFFSPRLIASRLNILFNPEFYIHSNPIVRKEAWKTLFGIAGMVATSNAIGSMVFGGETKYTPTLQNITNPDFGKIRFGKTRLDPGAGVLQYIVAASKFISGKATSSTSGRTYQLGKFGSPTKVSALIGIGGQQPSFMENKLSPMVGLADTILSGRKNITGEPINVKTEIAKSFIPLMMQDLWDLYQSDPDLMGLGIPASMGMGLQTYQDPGPKGLGGFTNPGIGNLKP